MTPHSLACLELHALPQMMQMMQIRGSRSQPTSTTIDCQAQMVRVADCLTLTTFEAFHMTVTTAPALGKSLLCASLEEQKAEQKCMPFRLSKEKPTSVLISL